MSLHYPVKLENAHRARATIELLEKENFIPPQIWIPLITACGNIAIEFCRRYYEKQFGLFFPDTVYFHDSIK